MKMSPYICKSTFFVVSLCAPLASYGGLITAIPGPDDQGGMIMPVVTISGNNGTNPTSGTINISFDPLSTPVLRSLKEWSPGNWFAETSSWRSDLSPDAGSVPNMPAANAGNGDLFNNQYGFMFMSMGTTMMADVPDGNALAIRLNSISSPHLKSFNYGNLANRWDPVFDHPDDQVLWSGQMWHNYFTLPADAESGIYTAYFEIFIANTPFTGTTGFAQYDTTAQDALKNINFASAYVTYEFAVIPEPVTTSIVLSILGLGWAIMRRNRSTSNR